MRLCLTGFKVVDQPPKLLFSCSGSGEEAVVDFQHQGGESRDVNGIIAGGGAGLGRSRPGAVVILRIEELVPEHLVVLIPAFTSIVDCRLAGIIVLIEVAGTDIVVELRFLIDILDALAGIGDRGSLVLLETEGTSADKSGVAIA